MYAELADKLVLSSAADQFSPAVSMAGANAVQLNVVVLVIPGATTLTIDIQGSNDMQNWASLNTFTTTVVGYVSTAKSTAVQWQYVRVRMNSNTAGNSIVTIGLNTAQL